MADTPRIRVPFINALGARLSEDALEIPVGNIILEMPMSGVDASMSSFTNLKRHLERQHLKTS